MRRLMAVSGLGIVLATAAAAQSTEPGALAACKATTLRAAADCLRENLSEDDRIGLVAAREGTLIRMQIDRRVRSEMRLGDPASHLSVWFAKHGIKTSMFRSAVVIDEYLANQRASSLDLAKIAAIEPPEKKLPAVGEDRGPGPPPGTPLSLEECARRTKVPLADIGECWANGDKLMMTKRESEKIGGGPNER